MENKELLKARQQLVIKHNDLIQRSRFDLSLQQQKIVLYLISKIKPDDEEFKLYEFSIRDFCRICKIETNSGKNYDMLKEAIQEVADKSCWVKLEDGKQTLVRWIEKPYIDEKSGIIKIKLDELMKPYLLHLKNNFTQYQLCWTLQFRKKYSVRLYELIKSVHYDELSQLEIIYDVEELKKLLSADNYSRYNHFKERALEPAIEEINRLSDKTIKYEPIIYGNTVGRIKFIISTKNSKERFLLEVKHNPELLEE